MDWEDGSGRYEGKGSWVKDWAPKVTLCCSHGDAKVLPSDLCAGLDSDKLSSLWMWILSCQCRSHLKKETEELS